MRRLVLMLFATRLFASDARFTDELWVGIEPAYQRALARGTPVGEPRGLRNALTTLAAKAPRAEWRVTLENLAATMPQSPGGPVTYPRFAEGFAAILPHFWIRWELAKDLQKRDVKSPEYRSWIDRYSSESYRETVSQLIRMMNAQAERMDPAARER